MRRALDHVVIPFALYVLGFVVLTWPRVLDFGTTYWCDEGDGLANAWNLWWVDRAFTAGGALLATDHLHFPHGTSLAGHTLGLLHALLAIPLSRVLGPVGAYDALVLFSFVGSGVTAYWLALDATGRRGASLAGGALFAFSSYAFAHAEGHLNLIALETLPLFALAFVKLIDRPSRARAALAAGALALVALSELSYAFYAALAGALLLVPRARSLVRKDVPALALFLVLALVVTAPLGLPLWKLARTERLEGVHTSADYSLDLLSIVVPGGHWRFASLTEPFWSRLRANVHETSVHLGLGTLALVALARGERRRWLWLFFGSLVLALGPRLHVNGWEAPVVRLPYRLLEGASSTIRISGMPIRIVVLATLASSVLAAQGVARLWDAGKRGRLLAVALLALVLLERLPCPIPASPATTPPWVSILRELPDGGVIDDVSKDGRLLFHQTIHGKKLAFGHLARLPRSVKEKDDAIRRALDAGDIAALGSAGFRYVVVAPSRAFPGKTVHLDLDAKIVAIGD